MSAKKKVQPSSHPTTVTVRVELALEVGTVSVILADDAFVVADKDNVLKSRHACIKAVNLLNQNVDDVKQKFHKLLFK